MQAVIMAGGKGTRLFSITKDEIPKPMVQIDGKPLLWYQIEMLKRNGIKTIYIVIGHKGDIIRDTFREGHEFGINIQYVLEEQPLGTAGALYYLKEQIKSDFLLLFGDLMLDIFVDRFYSFHRSKNALATMFVHPNSHPYDSDLVVLDHDNKVVKFDSKNNVRDYFYTNCVNAGVYIFSNKILDNLIKPQKMDLEKDVLLPILERHEGIYGYRSSEYVKDIGTPDRLERAKEDLDKGYIAKRNLRNKQKCIFMDRDGTINIYKGLIYKHEDIEIDPKNIQAINKINNMGLLSIIITNQPVVARGLCSISDVELIHRKLQTLIGKEGAFVDDIFFCPHHPDRGYPEENPLYKIHCNCRKPSIELILECVDKYNIDLSGSWFIGDTTVDIQTGKNAGLKTILVKTGLGGKDNKYYVEPDVICEDLFDAVNYIEKEVLY